MILHVSYRLQAKNSLDFSVCDMVVRVAEFPNDLDGCVAWINLLRNLILREATPTSTVRDPTVVVLGWQRMK